LARVHAGATLYVSLDDAVLDDFAPWAGVQVESRTRRPGILDFVAEQDDLHVSLEVPIRYRFRLVGAEVLAVTKDDFQPIWTHHIYGRGEIFLLAAPLEIAWAKTPGACELPQTSNCWKMYRRILGKVIDSRILAKNDPQLTVTEHMEGPSSAWLVVINHGCQIIRQQLRFSSGWKFTSILHGEITVEGSVDVPAYDAVILKVQRGYP
jgi:hypothetical protein